MSGRNDFVALIKEIGRDLDLDVDTMASDWIIKLSVCSSKFTFIYGYNFDLNGSASQQVRFIIAPGAIIIRFVGIRTQPRCV